MDWNLVRTSRFVSSNKPCRWVALWLLGKCGNRRSRITILGPWMRKQASNLLVKWLTKKKSKKKSQNQSILLIKTNKLIRYLFPRNLVTENCFWLLAFQILKESASTLLRGKRLVVISGNFEMPSIVWFTSDLFIRKML